MRRLMQCGVNFSELGSLNPEDFYTESVVVTGLPLAGALTCSLVGGRFDSSSTCYDYSASSSSVRSLKDVRSCTFES